MNDQAESTRKYYKGKDVTVSFDSAVCKHAGYCVRGLPGVFDTNAKPWINPDGSDADAVRAQVERCPSGALGHHAPDAV